MKPLLVGDMPSRGGDKHWRTPLSGGVARLLCRIIGIPEQEANRRWTAALYERFDCTNAMLRRRAWDLEQASSELRTWLEDEREVVVLLGTRAQEAYVRMTDPAESPVEWHSFYEWVVDPNSPTGRREVVVIPHLASFSRTGSMSRRAGRILREAIDKAREMEETKL